QVLTMIAVATCFECVGSILWGAYRYRLGNLPLYVPAGHGIFFLLAVRVADLPWLALHRRLVVGGVFAGSLLLVARGLFLLPTLDLLGAATWLLFVAFLFRGQRPLFYAVSFTVTMALEFYGTSFGIWAWAPMLPYVGLSAGNPPAGIGAGYCAMDSVAHRLAPSVEKLWLGLSSLRAKSPMRSVRSSES
ncbi:MAG: hypothetical protein HW416_1814, partial [Chloroflexi bacterium]|nr:hypothetical protein [Chloroflexota bacterium]